jgi:hypothetical protein
MFCFQREILIGKMLDAFLQRFTISDEKIFEPIYLLPARDRPTKFLPQQFPPHLQCLSGDSSSQLPATLFTPFFSLRNDNHFRQRAAAPFARHEQIVRQR